MPGQSLTRSWTWCRSTRGVLAIWGLAAAIALAGAPPALAQQRGGTLIAAFSADPAGFDPVRGPSGMSHVVIEQVYSTLMLLDPGAQPIPGLA